MDLATHILSKRLLPPVGKPIISGKGRTQHIKDYRTAVGAEPCTSLCSLLCPYGHSNGLKRERYAALRLMIPGSKLTAKLTAYQCHPASSKFSRANCIKASLPASGAPVNDLLLSLGKKYKEVKQLRHLTDALPLGKKLHSLLVEPLKMTSSCLSVRSTKR